MHSQIKICNILRFHKIHIHVVSDEIHELSDLIFSSFQVTLNNFFKLANSIMLYLTKKHESSSLYPATIILLASISGHIKSWHIEMISSPVDIYYIYIYCVVRILHVNGQSLKLSL